MTGQKDQPRPADVGALGKVGHRFGDPLLVHGAQAATQLGIIIVDPDWADPFQPPRPAPAAVEKIEPTSLLRPVFALHLKV